MERSANLPPPPAASIPIRSAVADPNQYTSSSSSSPSLSPPRDFLRHINAVFKRHRPLGTMQSHASRASRVFVSQAEPPKRSAASAPIASNNIGKRRSQAGAPLGAVRLPNIVLDQRKDGAGELVRANANPPEDSSLTPPSITGTVTTTLGENMSPFSMQRENGAQVDEWKKASLLPVPLSRLPLDGNSSLAFQSSDAEMITQTRMVDISSDFYSLALTEGEDHPGNRVAVDDDDLNQGHFRSAGVSSDGTKFGGGGGADLLERRDKLGHDQHYVDAGTRSMVAGTACASTISVHSGPTSQGTRAPAGQTASATQMSSTFIETALEIHDQVLHEGHGVDVKEDDGLPDHRQALHLGEDIEDRGASVNATGLHSQVTSINDIRPSNGSSQSSKAEKAPHKKKYDPDVFFKVNRKLYQKLGKIGSGGSSEVYKVISSDCTIYALKKIKLKGRDYPTAYGFCQEIEYLNMLKGKNNIIQLIDYEVTDKTLLQGIVNGSLSTKDGRIKEDQYIYMVLEQGEIDLAHMLSHKWKEMDSSSWKLDDNWLRFYWQQMLEAVNTIHEERIVHSDLKPANFLLVRGSLKLIDFGIAKAIMSDTTNIQRDAQVGTLNYMSPEAFMWNEHDANGNTIKCGRPSDIWSLGCILYQMVYGKTPFAEYKSFWAKFKVITDRNHEITYEPVLNPWLIDLMRRCLAWDRNERWRIPQLLQHPFLVPAMPRELPPFLDHPCKLLMERVGVYWNDPEVSRLCFELQEIVANLEKRKRELGLPAEANAA